MVRLRRVTLLHIMIGINLNRSWCLCHLSEMRWIVKESKRQTISERILNSALCLMTTAMMILIMIFVLLTKMMAVRFDYDGGVDDDDDDVGGCWSRGEVPQAQCWSDQGLGRPHLLTQPPPHCTSCNHGQQPSITTLKHWLHHQMLPILKKCQSNKYQQQL